MLGPATAMLGLGAPHDGVAFRRAAELDRLIRETLLLAGRPADQADVDGLRTELVSAAQQTIWTNSTSALCFIHRLRREVARGVDLDTERARIAADPVLVLLEEHARHLLGGL